ncbi:hypothetical protein [Neobacillus jeddahensis]|uniref:hypothetical protein n=1 Tax=Neobacillus jeddahensis TaxID=1461580 RepID=UPI00069465C7|nr:hypothetical protein [Neobacillus jeddahensis]
MGGYGSGAYGLLGSKVRKRTVEETFCLEIKGFKGNLNGRTLRMSWNNGEKSIGIKTNVDHIVLFYYADEEPIKENVGIESTKVGFGERLWFCCPECDKKTARLYLVGKYFRCRDCHQLTYSSCQESGDPLDYLYLKIRRLQRKLGLDGKGVDPYALPYFKPKNMHYKTFIKLRNQLESIQDERERAFLSHHLNNWC